MKKAKISAFLLALIMTIASVGCSSDADSSDSGKTQSSTESASESVEKVTLPPAQSPAQTEDSETSSEDEPSDGEDSSELTPAMWLATSPDGDTMYMMGSMHALKDECYPLPDYVTDAYEQADILAVECDISDISATFSASVELMDKMYYSDGTTLKDHISEEAYNNVDSYLEAHGEDISYYENMQPWYLSSVVENYAVADADLESGKGLDITLLQSAHDDGKEIYEVESISFQMQLLADFSDDLYDIMLSEYSAENMDELNDELEKSYIGWKTGDVDTFEESPEDYEGYTEEQLEIIDDYNKQMLYDRNIGMAQKVKELMERDEKTLFVVGAAHFVGEGGIIDLLEDEGYTFELVNAQE